MGSSTGFLEVNHLGPKDYYLNINKQIPDFVFENSRGQFMDLENLGVSPESNK